MKLALQRLDPINVRLTMPSLAKQNEDWETSRATHKKRLTLKQSQGVEIFKSTMADVADHEQAFEKIHLGGNMEDRYVAGSHNKGPRGSQQQQGFKGLCEFAQQRQGQKTRGYKFHGESSPRKTQRRPMLIVKAISKPRYYIYCTDGLRTLNSLAPRVRRKKASLADAGDTHVDSQHISPDEQHAFVEKRPLYPSCIQIGSILRDDAQYLHGQQKTEETNTNDVYKTGDLRRRRHSGRFIDFACEGAGGAFKITQQSQRLFKGNGAWRKTALQENEINREGCQLEKALKKRDCHGLFETCRTKSKRSANSQTLSLTATSAPQPTVSKKPRFKSSRNAALEHSLARKISVPKRSAWTKAIETTTEAPHRSESHIAKQPQQDPETYSYRFELGIL
jgi:hypothetical protein